MVSARLAWGNGSLCPTQEAREMSQGRDDRLIREQVEAEREKRIAEQIEAEERRQQEEKQARDDTDRIIRDAEDRLDDWEPKR